MPPVGAAEWLPEQATLERVRVLQILEAAEELYDRLHALEAPDCNRLALDADRISVRLFADLQAAHTEFDRAANSRPFP